MTHENTTTQKFRQTQDKLILKLMPSIRKNGFQTLRMDDIAKIMDISRATLYKYFPNKEDLFHKVTDGFVQYLNDMIKDLPKEETLYITKFQQLFEQSVSLALFITDDFLDELQHAYPSMYDKLWETIQFREKQLLIFYNEGMESGIFNKINGRLLILQDKMLFTMLDPIYLMKNQLTIEQMLFDFYQLRKLQLFKPESISTIDDSSIMSRIDHLSKKAANVLL
ncbi:MULTISPECIES: TetR/AcrR family transcriptional regulator [Priestia]|uniref:TetR/AcrR family transcriptional regulator n=1 Tax=Priestia TaxID=2800373 RepID=UPI00263B246F|nr:TetR/AcrR family transcriptional regulator [Priestia megaterium]MCF6799666.1 TetR/AcrR family transcriptional regulator [Bacillus sp. ET1]MDN4865598.1 TetR/AcrR family transcriptional regulator [Priestia megaterium]MED4183525.1 TetR/AcrR family transcriptional regulator [Priestia megaterium]